MEHWRAVLLLLSLAAAGAPLFGQASNTEVEISYVLPDTISGDMYIVGEGTSGPSIVALVYPMRLVYSDTTAATATHPAVTKRLELLADRAVIWFELKNPGDKLSAKEPLRAGVKNLQFYGEGNIWMRFSINDQGMTLRSDRIYLDFALAKVASFKAKGEDEFVNELRVKGVLEGVKAHSDRSKGGDGAKIEGGIGVGEAESEARDPTRGDNVGAPPSSSADPVPAGTPKSLPQERGQRLFLRARELKILSLTKDNTEITLEDGSISSSSLAVASYSLAAKTLRLKLTPLRQTAYVSYPSVRVLDFPLLTLGVENYAYDLDSSPPIRQLELGRSSQYGYWFRTYVDAIATYDLFADPEPPFGPLQLGPQVDWYSLRGLGTGVNLDWGGMSAFQPFGRAAFRSYYIRDRGDDRDRARELGWFPLENEDRGRVLGAYSQNFGAGWQLDNIFNYESDPNFRREFYQREYNNNEPLDSFVMLTKRSGALGYFLLLQPRVHDWRNQTEYLPTLGFDVSRAAVGDFGLQLSSHSEVSLLMFRPIEDDPRREIATPRAHTATWFNLPFSLGMLALDPYAGIHATGSTHFLEFSEDTSRPGLSADGTFPGLRPGDERKSGVLYRLMPFFGMNVQTFITGTFPGFKIPGLGIDGLRHVFAPFARYRNVAYNSLDDIPGRSFIPMDGIDTLDEFHEIRVGFRNRLQTRTGKGAERQTTDYFEVMMELPLYPNYRRDNGGRFYGDIEVAASWRPAPGYSIEGTMFLDPLSGNFNRASASFRFDLLDYGRANIYYRLLKGQYQVVGVAIDLAPTEVYSLSAKQEYDLENGEFRDTRIELTRRILEAVDVGFVFARDAVEGDVGFYFRISTSFRAPGGGASLFR